MHSRRVEERTWDVRANDTSKEASNAYHEVT